MEYDYDTTKRKRGRFSRFFVLALAISIVAIAGVAVATLSHAPVTEPPEEIARPSLTTTTTTTATTTRVTTTVRTTAPTTKSAVAANAEPQDLTILPLSNAVIRPFSGDVLVFSSTMQDWRTHNGTDFAGTLGQTVRAAADATVTQVAADPLWGDTITFSCADGVTLRYCGVTPKAGLKAGTTVKVGDTVGTLTAIPAEQADKPHLHLEVKQGATWLDPVKWIGRETTEE